MALYTVPRMGGYTDILIDGLRELGLDVVAPPGVSSSTNKLGVLSSVEMVCWPYKATLGTLISAVEGRKGTGSEITDIVTYSSEGQCRFRHYGELYRLALKNLGYKGRVHMIRNGSITGDLRRLTGASYMRVWKVVARAYRRIAEFEEREERMYSGRALRILLIGEIYTLLEPDVNFNLRKKLLELGASSILTCTLSHFISEIVKGNKVASTEAESFISKKVGGHGFQNIVHLLKEIDGVDGVTYVYPLTCMPESTVTPIIEDICRLKRKPVLRIEIDDNSSELNVQTRLEAFVETIKMSRGAAAGDAGTGALGEKGGS